MTLAAESLNAGKQRHGAPQVTPATRPASAEGKAEARRTADEAAAESANADNQKYGVSKMTPAAEPENGS